MNLPTQKMPFDVRPFHRETLESYSRRLLTANFSDDSHRASMTRELRTDNSAEATRDAWLRVLTTRTKRSTLYVDPLPAGGLTHRDRTTCHHFATSLPGRIGCTLCSRGTRIEQNPHFDTIVCTTHHRWLGLWGSADTQHRIGDDTVAAHRTFEKLRRKSLIDLRLYRLLIKALSDALYPGLPVEQAEPLVFAAAIRTIHALTQDNLARRVLHPAIPFATAYAHLDATVTATTGTSLPSVSRALWIYLRPTMLALRDAITGGAPFRPAWEHDYPVRANIAASLTAFTGELEPVDNYLAISGDTPVTAALTTAQLNTLQTADTQNALQTFTCPGGHTFDYLPPVVLPATMTATMFTPTCGICTERRVRPGMNDVQTMSPAVATQFDPHSNGGLTAADVANSSSTKYWWICTTGHSHQVSPSKKTLPTYKCPICSNRTPRSGTNCLLTTHPEIAARWANGWSEHTSPATITAGSNVLAQWRCDNGHLFHARPYELTLGNLECNICKRERTIDHDTSLAATHPDQAARWHPTMNGTLTPRNVTRGERRWVWWLCEQGHEESARIDKVSLGQKCPVCSNRKLKQGFNDLATVEPILSLELHPSRNRYAADEMFPSDHALYWKCLTNGHLHIQTTQNRRSSNGCPKCKPAERILFVAREAETACIDSSTALAA